ncbi:tetratricopeptide repeat protein [Rhizobiaceae bacterium n13]|uniref:Tetratricopeptide repeat protein n=1 Tax=Ferirhizobium litorale TaxID=2927786 RepID=A0AAE3QF81_9HYPH|nr:tetratricopeptide repeat protein [Fererhizobium litorale]MDI7862296.1 tetratricopeptide repeat protein [Fererhizobium litorale]MDI7922430.1 tetratricopeptide repeat protein [Fererhizobium litorale]
MKRRLTAILDADVVGYSRLMEIDETGTLYALRAHRTELVAPAIARHHGRIVKLIGDGTMAEFASVIDAVTCAMAIQKAMLRRNEGVEQSRRIDFRIGIHLGDVMVEDDDIYGEGVNVAARLQQLAPPGGICMSQQVQDQMGSKLKLDAADLGDRKLRNIKRPVHVWQWTPDGSHKTSARRVSQGEDPAMEQVRPSLAVLPFLNVSGAVADENFCDGFTEEIIATLARCRWLRVAARNSSFTYKGRSVDVRKAAEELGVKYVLEGSVRRAGDRVRVTVQLLKGTDGTHLWSERYDHEYDDVFAIQDRVAAEISGTVEPELAIIEFAALRGRNASEMGAWESYLKGLWHLYRFAPDHLETARQLFERAIELDPDFAQAHARLAYVHIQLGWYGPLEERADRARAAVELASKAIVLDGREPAAHMALGRALALSGEPLNGIAHIHNALKLDPSFAQAHFALGQLLCYVQRTEEGIAEISAAIRLSPRDPHLWTFYNMLAVAYYQTGRMDEVVANARAALRQPNVTFWPAMVLAAALARQGRIAEARAAMLELLRFRPGMTLEDARGEFSWGNFSIMPHSFVDQFIEDLAKSGIPAKPQSREAVSC